MMNLFKEFKRKYSDFMPSQNVKDIWLFTLKKEANIQNAPMPGLFQSESYSLLVLGVFLIISFEFMATFIGYRYGVSVGAIVAMIILDFFIAYFSHFPEGKICELRNKLYVTENILIREQLLRQIGSKKNIQIAWYIIIAALGICKFIWFYLTYQIFLIALGLYFDAYVLLVLFCYLFAAFLHIKCTGYMLFTSRFQYAIHHEETKFIKQLDFHGKEKITGSDQFLVANKISYPIESSFELQTLSVGKHELVKNRTESVTTEKKDTYRYLFNIHGLLLDEELRQFVLEQINSAQRDIVSRAGIKIQLDILAK